MRTLFCTLIMSLVSVFAFAQTEPDFEMDDKNTSNIIINTGGTSPQQTLSIIKLETLDTKRRWKTGEAGSFTGASSNEDNSVVLKYKKYGENSVIVSTSALEPGEYCLAITNMMTNSKSAKVYTFRIK